MPPVTTLRVATAADALLVAVQTCIDSNPHLLLGQACGFNRQGCLTLCETHTADASAWVGDVR